ncbi:class I SAM-dependent methyltransferase [Natronococcus pandeyae]|uniref:Class I SAM-dependent methyltransferase n=1 Tax=Natronococcus pandeyae TaxID=2055836 RepID=A0A8J8Q2S6_9EURY|nr:class I SAM-dependent methyltransferase [Natronococcus pandeyae]TYL38222.1 class I SAM-dependent methyltransferase [Natronococcus pandeyae]
MVEKNAVRRSYDEIAEAYAAQRSENGRATQFLEGFLESLPDSARVLDAGCGQGTPVLTRLSESTTATAFGVDFSRGQLELAAANAPGASLVQGDMTTLPLEAATVDAVVAYWSLIHIPMDDHQAVVDEFARVLRPGGRLLLCEGTNRWAGENPDWLESGVRMEWNIAGADATREQLRTAGFEIADEWGVPEELNEEKDADDEDADGADAADEDGDENAGEYPWTFFAARLQPDGND